jgi:DNA-binding CsgD family transcriptional regulator
MISLVTLGRDASALAEIAANADSLFNYERAVLAVVAKKVGFDVAMFKRSGGCGPYTPGLDPAIKRACAPYWQDFAEEVQLLGDVAQKQRGVAVDVEVFGLRGLERLSYYQRLMRPHGGKSTAIICLARRGSIVGSLSLGRTGGGFRDSELAHLRALAPTLSVCEASVLSPAPAPSSMLGLAAALTPREREALSYLGLGYTNSQIAAALGSAERTVRNQLSSAYAKLGVASRAEAVALLAELGSAARTAP